LACKPLVLGDRPRRAPPPSHCVPSQPLRRQCHESLCRGGWHSTPGSGALGEKPLQGGFGETEGWCGPRGCLVDDTRPIGGDGYDRRAAAGPRRIPCRNGASSGSTAGVGGRPAAHPSTNRRKPWRVRRPRGSRRHGRAVQLPPPPGQNGFWLNKPDFQTSPQNRAIIYPWTYESLAGGGESASSASPA